MTMGILPSIMSVGLLGLILAEFTPVFDWLGYIFYPFTCLFQLPEPMLAAKASAVSIAEMFLPALLVTKAATCYQVCYRCCFRFIDYFFLSSSSVYFIDRNSTYDWKTRRHLVRKGSIHHSPYSTYCILNSIIEKTVPFLWGTVFLKFNKTVMTEF